MVGGDRIRDITGWKVILAGLFLLSLAINVHQWVGSSKAIRAAEESTEIRVEFEHKMNKEWQAKIADHDKEFATERDTSRKQLAKAKRKYAGLRTTILSIPIPPKEELEEILGDELGEITVDNEVVMLSAEDFKKFQLAVVDLGEARAENTSLLKEIEILNKELTTWKDRDEQNRELIVLYNEEVDRWTKAAHKSKLKRVLQYGVVAGAFVLGTRLGGG